MRTKDQEVWISMRAATRVASVSIRQVRHMMSRRLVATRRLPSGKVELLRSDVERLAAGWVRPAASQTEPACA